MTHDWTAEKLVETCHAFWTSSAINTAVELDVFSNLADCPLPVEKLATKLDLPLRSLKILARALVALGLLDARSDGLALTDFSRTHLCRGETGYMGHIISHFSHLQDGWANLVQAVRNNAPTCVNSSHTDSPERRESFLMGMVNMADLQARECVPLLPVQGRNRLLDLGGGPGGFTVQFCQLYPEMQATLFDLPTTKPLAEKYIARHKLQERINFVAGNFMKDTLPSGFDLVWLSQILHGQNPEDAASLVARAAGSLDKGGLLLVHEFVMNDDFRDSVFPALFGLNMLVNTEDGQSYTEKELVNMLKNAGLTEIRRLELNLPKGRAVLAGVKA